MNIDVNVLVKEAKIYQTDKERIDYIIDWFIKHTSFDLSTIHPFENVPLHLAYEEVKLSNCTTNLLPVYRKELQMPLFHNDEQLYNQLNWERHDKFEYAKNKTREYQKNLWRIGVRYTSNQEEINACLNRVQKENLEKSNPKNIVLNACDAAYYLKQILDKLNIDNEIVLGTARTIYGNDENFIWNKFDGKYTDLSSILIYNDKNTYFYKDSNEFPNHVKQKVKRL